MGNVNKNNRSNKSFTTIITAVGTLASVLTPITQMFMENLRNRPQKNNEEKDMVFIPPLYDKKFPLELEQAVSLLESYGLKTISSKLSIKDAAVKYKNCFVYQVIDSNPKHKKKVKIGTIVCVKYITQDVIQESQRLFVESQEQKAIKKIERKERVIENITNIKNKVKKQTNKSLTDNGEKN